MFELPVFLIFLALPLYVGYRAESYKAFLFPAILLCGSVLSYVSNRSSGGQPDEVDVIPVVLVVASVAGCFLFLVGVALGRRRQDTGDPPP